MKIKPDTVIDMGDGYKAIMSQPEFGPYECSFGPPTGPWGGDGASLFSQLHPVPPFSLRKWIRSLFVRPKISRAALQRIPVLEYGTHHMSLGCRDRKVDVELPWRIVEGIGLQFFIKDKWFTI